MALTYSNRSNARRAAIQSGLVNEQIEITVHKLSDGVRFGFKGRSPVPDKKITTCIENIFQATPSGVCVAIRAWLNQNPSASLGELKTVAETAKWNMTTVRCQYYRWRKSLVLNAEVL